MGKLKKGGREMSIKIALAGNPNCGKTTLFNALTGSNQFVGNWPGVTVEKKEGKLKGYKDIIIMDLPGIYSLSPYTLEEVVSRNYLIKERPDAIFNIVDGTNIERNLYLTTQLQELGIPMIVAVNMMDIVRKNGDEIYISKLSKELGCPVVEISALKGTGIKEAVQKVVEAGGKKSSFSLLHTFGEDVEEAIISIEEKLKGFVEESQKRFFAIKLFERDEKIKEEIGSAIHIEEIIKTVEEKMDDDAESMITNERYQYISHLIKDCYKKKNHEKLTISDKIDKIVTNRFLALPIFAIIMYIVYYVSVTTVGTFATDWANDGVFGEGWSLFGLWIPGIPEIVGGALEGIGCADWLSGLILDGIVAGVGAVLGFVPQILILFIFLAFLEACGYMARVAFIMDRIFRRFGLSGKSFIPMLIGSGCGVPGIMASRTIENERDRRMTIVTTTFIPCGAKLPIIAMFAGAVFGGSPWVAPSAYFVGIGAVVLSGILLKKTNLFSGDPAPFVMELPAYHMPTLGNVLRSMWERGWSFIKKAGTIILLSTIFVWFASSFGFENGGFGMVEDTGTSLLAALGTALSWIFIPVGFGDWQSTVAAITGLVAKENVVSTFGVLFHIGEVAEDDIGLLNAISSHYTVIAAYSFMVFNLLCAPCFGAMGAIKREMNSRKWFWFAVLYQTGLAYCVSLCIYQFGLLFTGQGFGIWTIVAIILFIGFIYLLFRPYKERNTLEVKFMAKAKA